jgi:hypothetical protein
MIQANQSSQRTGVNHDCAGVSVVALECSTKPQSVASSYTLKEAKTLKESTGNWINFKPNLTTNAKKQGVCYGNLNNKAIQSPNHGMGCLIATHPALHYCGLLWGFVRFNDAQLLHCALVGKVANPDVNINPQQNTFDAECSPKCVCNGVQSACGDSLSAKHRRTGSLYKCVSVVAHGIYKPCRRAGLKSISRETNPSNPKRHRGGLGNIPRTVAISGRCKRATSHSYPHSGVKVYAHGIGSPNRREHLKAAIVRSSSKHGVKSSGIDANNQAPRINTSHFNFWIAGVRVLSLGAREAKQCQQGNNKKFLHMQTLSHHRFKTEYKNYVKITQLTD